MPAGRLWAAVEEGLLQTIPTVALMFSLVLAAPAHAQPAVSAPPSLGGDGAFLSGARLLQMCQAENPTCTGYVAGVADALAPLSGPGGVLPNNSLASFCAQKLTIKQVIAEFQKFMKANPEGAQTNAAQLVGDALHLAYPCSGK
jgi:hypothetical protein